MNDTKVINIKYIFIHAFYWIAACAIGGYASVYLLSKGYSNTTIGIVLALVSAVSVFSATALSDFADKRKDIKIQTMVIIVNILVILSGILLYFVAPGGLLMLAVFSMVCTGYYTIGPLLNSLAFIFEKNGITVNYGLARGIGSAAYATASILLGYLTEKFGTNLLPLTYILFYGLLSIILYSYQIKNAVVDTTVKKVEEKQLSLIEFCKKYKMFMVFVIGCTLVYYNHVFFNNFMIQIIQPIGGTESSMGTAVCIAAILELPAMGCFALINKKFKTTTIINFSTFFFTVKHALLFFAKSMLTVYATQCLQFFAYAFFYPALVIYANEVISPADANKGQNMVAISATIAGVLAGLLGGVILDHLSVSFSLLFGIVASILGELIVFYAIKKINKSTN